MVKPILIKSNQPTVGLVTIEYGTRVMLMSAKDYNDITSTLSSNDHLRIKIEQIFEK